MDYYTETSLEVPLSQEEQDWAIEFLDYLLLEPENRLPEYDDLIAAVGGEYLEPGFGVGKQEGYLWIKGEHPDLEAIANFIQCILIHFNKDIAVGFQWANTAGRPIPDGFGGGACVVTKNEQDWLNTAEWASTRVWEHNHS